MTATDRIVRIIQLMEDIEKSSLSVSQYFKERNVPFGRAQYYLYKKTIEEKGIEGLIDLRNKGNNLKLTDEIKIFVKGLIIQNQSIQVVPILVPRSEELNIFIFKYEYLS
jgi:hypothetical protein